MPISFDTTGSQARWRTEYEDVIALAIDVSRPPVEQWTVAMIEMTEPPIVRMEFDRDDDEPWSLTFIRDTDDSEHVALYRILCYFLRKIPGGVEPS